MAFHMHRVAYRTHPQVRPFLLARGRTRVRTRYPLMIHTMVSAPYYDPAVASTLAGQERSVYEYARHRMSVAEVAAHTGLSLGLARVVLGDLAGRELVAIDPVDEPTVDDFVSVSVLERVLDGLKRL